MRSPPGDFEEIELSNPADERRSTGTLGDRLIVGLAALVLLAGIMIAGGNLLKEVSGDEEIAAASSTPLPSGATTAAEPSRTPRPTSSPRPPRQVTVAERSPDPPPDYGQDQTMAWLEVLADVPLMNVPSQGSPPLTTIPAGSVLLVSVDVGRPGWAQTAEPVDGGRSGFIATRDADGTVVAIVHPADVQPRGGDIQHVWAIAGGYVAMGAMPAVAGNSWRPRLFVSPDGEHWQLANTTEIDQMDVWSLTMADGPSGLLAIGPGSLGNGLWLAESGDGSTWSRVGALDGTGSGWPLGMVGSDLGYLIFGGEEGFRRSTVQLWYSPDGISWIESRADLQSTDSGQVQLLAVENGFIAWVSPYGPEDSVVSVAYSANGRSWTTVGADAAALRGQLQLGSTAATLLGVTTKGDGTVRAWRADLTDRTSMHLIPDEAAEAAFGSLRGVQLVSDGTEAFLLGYDASGVRAQLWESDGGSWRQVRMPAADHIGPRPRLGAVGPDGLVVIGTRPTAAGDNPVFWHLRRSGTWTVEREPIIPLLPDPTPSQCGSLPTTALDFVLVPQVWAPYCFGDQPITITAWSPTCDWCNPGPDSGDTAGTPAWLMRWSGDVELRPAKGEAWFGNNGILAPGLSPADWGDQWVRVTGHFADPASDTCAWGSDFADPIYQTSGTAVIWCRQRFVITAIETADGP
jgi:hypothetical protein